jgi:hypothetical protein
MHKFSVQLNNKSDVIVDVAVPVPDFVVAAVPVATVISAVVAAVFVSIALVLQNIVYGIRVYFNARAKPLIRAAVH